MDIAEERTAQLRRCSPEKLRLCASQTERQSNILIKTDLENRHHQLSHIAIAQHAVNHTWVPNAYISAGVPSIPTAVTNVTSIEMATGTVRNLQQQGWITKYQSCTLKDCLLLVAPFTDTSILLVTLLAICINSMLTESHWLYIMGWRAHYYFAQKSIQMETTKWRKRAWTFTGRAFALASQHTIIYREGLHKNFQEKSTHSGKLKAETVGNIVIYCLKMTLMLIEKFL